MQCSSSTCSIPTSKVKTSGDYKNVGGAMHFIYYI